MKMRRKRDLPQKTCMACGRPFFWRRKWARDWEHVRFCSERCRRDRGRQPQTEADQLPPLVIPGDLEKTRVSVRLTIEGKAEGRGKPRPS